MKKWFYAGLAGLVVFEVLKIYFIMPMPGSQRMNSLEFAYFLHTCRWAFRGVFLLMLALGIKDAFAVPRKWVPAVLTLAGGAIVGYFNFKMSADHMFREPAHPDYQARAKNQVDENAVVVGIEFNGEAKAYPLRYLVYHHQVRDTVGGKPVMVTYCSVCRTGRVFSPLVDGKPETFRLVGMDHFNAMFEDATTGSWWRQVTGEAVIGKRKGVQLAELRFQQLTLRRWFALHPASTVLQADETTKGKVDPEAKYERGESKGELTRTNPASWQDKSWVVGVQAGGATKAFDWNQLKRARVINADVGSVPVVLALAKDDQSFVVFERPAGATFTLDEDMLVASGRRYDFAGHEIPDSPAAATAPASTLLPVLASQEFWHSWRTFYPKTAKAN